ncbi:hypothetical protein [Methylobacterium aquaticum]|jgi:hypothetical protein|uniref:Uncharacterized protein n=1 Tax=Methylobacterium aquaticum TaxID=270351 RepID=A0A0J6SPP4_9HYPH|nr:hypothetical protein [Methylobacterium aquaticum]KMO35577.1 hypothetical protein VP06_11915 [Methylobacterium aquaticum]
MPATPEDVRARIAGAARAARAAAATAERESKAALDRLIQRPAGDRFAALENGAPQLLPEHRLELLRSVRLASGQTAPAARPVVGHASAWAVWRGRLPFQAGRLTRDALLTGCALAALVVAWWRTPEAWIEIRSDRDVAASWIMPDGRPGGDRLVAGRAYGLMRRANNMAELRDWHPGVGYAVTQVPVEGLRTSAAPR